VAASLHRRQIAETIGVLVPELVPVAQTMTRSTSWVNPDVEVRASTIDGRGLFARRPFHAGERVLVLGGRLIDDQELAQLAPQSSLAIEEGLNLMQAGDDVARFGNHSCNPNCWMSDEITVVTRRDVAKGEELTQDYAVMSVTEQWTMECRCGSDLCRGVVTGRDWKLSELQRCYRDHFSPFINRRIALLDGSLLANDGSR